LRQFSFLVTFGNDCHYKSEQQQQQVATASAEQNLSRTDVTVSDEYPVRTVRVFSVWR